MLQQRNRIIAVYIWGIVALFTGLYISLLFNHNIWTDEAFTIQLIKGNLKEIIEGTAKDVHPPLYYLYLKPFTMLFGDSLLVQKAVSIIPMTATLIFGATVIRKNFGDAVAALFLLFITCIPCSMEFAVQVRMYSLALFCVTVCGVYAYLAFMNGQKWEFVIFALSGTAAAYTHYFAFVSVIVITGIFLIAILLWRRERLPLWTIAAAAMIVLYSPWIPFFVKQVTTVTGGYWIPEITAETVWKYFTWTFDLAIVPGVVFLFLIILKTASVHNTINISKNRDKLDIYALVCMLIPTITAILGVLISWYKTPIYRDQYVFPALGLLALFFGLSMRNMKRCILVVISVFLLLVGAGQYKECFHQEYRSTYVPQTEAFFAENLQPNDYIVYNWDIFGFIYECYFPKDCLEYLEDFDFSQDFRVAWFLDSEWMPDVDQAVLEQNGLKMELMGHYGIEHNEFDIYKIYR